MSIREQYEQAYRLKREIDQLRFEIIKGEDNGDYFSITTRAARSFYATKIKQVTGGGIDFAVYHAASESRRAYEKHEYNRMGHVNCLGSPQVDSQNWNQGSRVTIRGDKLAYSRTFGKYIVMWCEADGTHEAVL